MLNFATRLSQLRSQNLYRDTLALKNGQGVLIKADGQKLINFASNDYLGLANHVAIKTALIEGVEKYGVSSGASHLISGHFDIHNTLEQTLNNYCNTEASLLFSSGYLANLAFFSALKDDLMWVLSDKLNHASLLDANRLIGLPIRRYLHNNISSLSKKLAKLKVQYPNSNGLIASDVVFSMDGDSINVTEFKNQATKFNTLLLLDGAHHFGMQKLPKINKNIAYMGTFGKAIGTMGAFITGSSPLIDYISQKARSYIYTTALAPAVAYATVKSIAIIKTGVQQTKLEKNIDFFKQIAKQYNLNFMSSNTAIQPIIISSNKAVIALQQQLKQTGYLVAAVRSPTVKEGTERLRISLSANHTQTQIKNVLYNLASTLSKVKSKL